MTIHEHRAQYYETDQMGIIHHSNYIRWMEEARLVMMEELGMGYSKFEELGIISPVLEVNCEYKKMVKFDDTVCIRAMINEYNGVKLTVMYEIYDKESGEVRAIGNTKHCFLDRNLLPVRLKKNFSQFDKAVREECERNNKVIN